MERQAQIKFSLGASRNPKAAGRKVAFDEAKPWTMTFVATGSMEPTPKIRGGEDQGGKGTTAATRLEDVRPVSRSTLSSRKWKEHIKQREKLSRSIARKLHKSVRMFSGEAAKRDGKAGGDAGSPASPNVAPNASEIKVNRFNKAKLICQPCDGAGEESASPRTRRF